MNDVFYWIAVAATVITSSARITRLVTYDKFPPIEWLRDKYADATDGSGWQLLAFCAYCASFWVTAAVVGLGLWAGVFGDADGVPDHTFGFLAWWVVNGVFGGSYLSAIMMVHDGEPEPDEVTINQRIYGADTDFPIITDASEDEN